MSRKQQNQDIKKIVSNNVTYIDRDDIASVFNDYFCNIGDEYDNNIPQSDLDPCDFINVSHSSSFFLEPVSSIEVEYHIKNLKNSKQDINCISISLLKENSELLSNVISELINICFQTGKFPNV